MTDLHSGQSMDLPGSDLDVTKMPGHWLLARLGKRVLRPGGLGLTRAMLRHLAIGPADEVVEFAPGLGVTARAILQRRPRRYTAVERDAKAARWTAGKLPQNPEISVVVGRAHHTRPARIFRNRSRRRGHVEHADGRAQAPDRRGGIPAAPFGRTLWHPRACRRSRRHAGRAAARNRSRTVLGHSCRRSPAYRCGVEGATGRCWFPCHWHRICANAPSPAPASQPG